MYPYICVGHVRRNAMVLFSKLPILVFFEIWHLHFELKKCLMPSFIISYLCFVASRSSEMGISRLDSENHQQHIIKFCVFWFVVCLKFDVPLYFRNYELLSWKLELHFIIWEFECASIMLKLATSKLGSRPFSFCLLYKCILVEAMRPRWKTSSTPTSQVQKRSSTRRNPVTQ